MKLYRCNRCEGEYPASSFNKDKSTLTGLQRKCKICQQEINEEYRRSLGIRPREALGEDAKRIHITLPVTLLRDIDRARELTGTPRSEYIRDAVRAFLEEVKGE